MKLDNLVVSPFHYKLLAQNTPMPCEGSDPVLFFSPDPSILRYTKTICSDCPLKQDCLEHALYQGEYGIWGGTDEEERRHLRRRLKIEVQNNGYSQVKSPKRGAA